MFDLLLELYPNGIIPNISDISNKKPNLYVFLKNYCNKNFIDKIDYISNLGFEIKKNAIENTVNIKEANVLKEPTSNIDTYTLKELTSNYDCNKSELAKLLCMKSKQNLDVRINVKKLTIPFWQQIDYTYDEKLSIISTIRKRDLFYDDINTGLSIRIYLRKKIKEGNKSNIAILLKNNDVIKCKFEFPKEIYDELVKYGYNVYEKKDLRIIKDIYTKKGLCDFISNDSGITTIKINDNKFNSKLSSRTNELKITKEDYMEYLGFKTLNKNLIYDTETIIDILKGYITEDNIVKVPIDDPNYHILVSLASRKGYKNYPDMLTKLGFNYERIVNREQSKMSHVDIINKRYVVYDKKIYIPSQDPYYNRLTSYSKKRKISLDDYMTSLGFERIKTTKELPKEYKPFDWKTEEKERFKIAYTDEKIAELLDSIANEENEIYLDTNSQIYFHLVKICNILDIKIDTLLEMYSYKRIYKYKRLNKNDTEKIDKHNQNIDEPETEKNYIKKLLEELEQIQDEKKHIVIESEKRLRNRTLVEKLKRLYHYKCQLCSNDENEFKTPIIEKDDGTYYVEVHHIEELSLESKYVDDDINLDTYKNAIVLCCYHHKYVHHHLGGFEKLVIDNTNSLYLQSKHGELLKIHTNHHLFSNVNLEE